MDTDLLDKATAPHMNVDFYAPEVVEDPWPTFARIRDTAPIVWNEAGGGHWMSAHNRVCRHVLYQPEKYVVKPLAPAFFGEEAFIAIDERAKHNALRNVWAASFRRDALQVLGGYIRNLAAEMLDPLVERLKAGETVEMVSGMCRSLPVYVIAHMMGVPSSMRDEIVRWTDLMANATSGGFTNIDYDNDKNWLASEQAKKELSAFLREQIRYRKKTPGEDLISQIVHSEIGATLSEDAILQNTRQLLFAGNETTAHWLGTIAQILGQRPDMRRELEQDNDLIPAAVEEMLRWQPVAQTLARNIEGGDATIEGYTIPDGALILVLIAGANRDPERYENPDELNFRREQFGSMAFGFGLHNCLGMTLARLEAIESTAELIKRMPPYEIAGKITYSGFNLRGPSRLNIVAR